MSRFIACCLALAAATFQLGVGRAIMASTPPHDSVSKYRSIFLKPSGVAGLSVTGIDNFGTVFGLESDKNAGQHPFVYDRSHDLKPQQLPDYGSTPASAFAQSANGLIAATYGNVPVFGADGATRTFSGWTALPSATGAAWGTDNLVGTVTSINPQGFITGYQYLWSSTDPPTVVVWRRTGSAYLATALSGAAGFEPIRGTAADSLGDVIGGGYVPGAQGQRWMEALWVWNGTSYSAPYLLRCPSSGASSNGFSIYAPSGAVSSNRKILIGGDCGSGRGNSVIWPMWVNKAGGLVTKAGGQLRSSPLPISLGPSGGLESGVQAFTRAGVPIGDHWLKAVKRDEATMWIGKKYKPVVLESRVVAGKPKGHVLNEALSVNDHGVILTAAHVSLDVTAYYALDPASCSEPGVDGCA